MLKMTVFRAFGQIRSPVLKLQPSPSQQDLVNPSALGHCMAVFTLPNQQSGQQKGTFPFSACQNQRHLIRFERCVANQASRNMHDSAVNV